MNESSETADARAELAWSRITRKSETGSFVEHQFAALVEKVRGVGRFHADVRHIDPAQDQA